LPLLFLLVSLTVTWTVVLPPTVMQLLSTEMATEGVLPPL
jgi:hypothetical protein